MFTTYFKMQDGSMSRRVLALLFCVLLVSACNKSASETAPEDLGWPEITLERIADGFVQPTHLTHAGDGSGRIFVSELIGRVKIIKDGVVLATPFLDITSRVGCCDVQMAENGFYGIAFPPNYMEKGYFYAMYANRSLHTVVSRISVSANPDIADPSTESTIINLGRFILPDHSTVNNGGGMVFGPDGYLYISIGDEIPDGGSNNGQDLATLFGKIIRIDVESGVTPYAIPPDNPFVGVAGAKEEIWTLGVKNAWRFSFDRSNGDMYVAVPGEWCWEAVYHEPAGSVGGKNYGWPLYEGSHCFYPVAGQCVPPSGYTCSTPENFTLPTLEYDHGQFEAVIGGFVYRGPGNCRMQGLYIYADLFGDIWGAKNRGGWTSQQLYEGYHGAPAASHAYYGNPKNGSPVAHEAGVSFDEFLLISSLGEDEEGNLYITEYKRSHTMTSSVYKITDPAGPQSCKK